MFPSCRQLLSHLPPKGDILIESKRGHSQRVETRANCPSTNASSRKYRQNHGRTSAALWGSIIVRYRCVMTKQEFIAKQRAYSTIYGKGADIPCLSLLGVTLIMRGGMELMFYVRKTVENQWVSFALSGVIFAIWFTPVLLICQLFFRSLMIKLLRLGLVCTGCGCAFYGPSAKIVLKTGKCGRCGKTVLDDISNV